MPEDILKKLLEAAKKIGPMPSQQDQQRISCARIAVETYLTRGYGTDINSADFATFFKRFEVAYNFYANSGANYSHYQIESHLKGIDFHYDVKITPIPPPNEVQQFQAARSKYQGNYYAPIGTPPDLLGIAPSGLEWDAKANKQTENVLIKVPNVYEVVRDNKNPDNRVTVLQSTSAPIYDDWSNPNKPVQTPGGATQLFCASTNAFRLVTKANLDFAPQSQQEQQAPIPAAPKTGEH